MQEEKIVLPKSRHGLPCLSYSQISTWRKNKRDYIRQYFFGEKFLGNAYTEFGSKVGEALESGNFSAFSDKEQKLLKTIPRYDEFEKEISLKFDGFHVIGYIDTNSKDYLNIVDYKTGEVKDDKIAEYQSDNYTQLDIYAAALKQKYGVLPTSAKVVLIDRKGNAFKNEKLVLGTKTHHIEKKIDEKRIAEVKKGIEETAKEISAYYKVFLKMNKNKVYV